MKSRLILTSNAYYPSIGGVENSLRHLAQEAKRAGMEPIIVVGDIGIHPPLRQVRESEVEGVKVIRYPLAPFSACWLRWLNLIASCFACWRIYRRLFSEQPQSIVIARFHFNALLAVWAGFGQVRYLVPSVVKFQSGVEIKTLSKFKQLLGALKIALHSCVQRAALNRCNNFVFSETMLNQCVTLAQNSPDKYRLVKPGIDPARFFPVEQNQKNALREHVGLNADARILLFVGRFVKAKGVDLILQALHLIKENDLQLVLVGEGAERAHYQSLIDQLGLKDRVFMFPPTSNVESFYQLADAFVMSSCYEPLGQTLLEAFASGLPVIAFRRSDVVDTATEELGMDEFVAYVDDYLVDSLSYRILDVNVGVFAYSLKIHDAAVRLFSWNALFNRLIANK